MTHAIELRPATDAHYPFALDLYLSAMRPYTEALMVWDETKQRSSFAAQWVLDEVRVIVVEGREFGWLQAADLPTEVRLLQFFIAPAERGGGVGTRVLAELLSTWQAMRKPVVLTVLKNNPALRLYQRLGFAVTGEVGVKYAMRWDPQ